MIPLKLQLRNFMSYRENVPPLLFDGFKVACLSGDNGHGKSALLDAITWALWGKARAKSEDELIHHGKLEMEVETVQQGKLPALPVKIMMNVGNPQLAFDFQSLPNSGVGLARLLPTAAPKFLRQRAGSVANKHHGGARSGHEETLLQPGACRPPRAATQRATSAHRSPGCKKTGNGARGLADRPRRSLDTGFLRSARRCPKGTSCVPDGNDEARGARRHRPAGFPVRGPYHAVTYL